MKKEDKEDKNEKKVPESYGNELKRMIHEETQEESMKKRMDKMIKYPKKKR